MASESMTTDYGAEDYGADTPISTQAMFPVSLTPHDPKKMQREQKAKFAMYESELANMHIDLKSEPTVESLTYLYSQQAKARAYFERTSEIYRIYVRYCANLGTILKQATYYYGVAESTAKEYAKTQAEYTKLKAQADREAYAKSFIPPNLTMELTEWQIVNDLAKADMNVVKSYNDQFKSAREDILMQLSIMKQLVALGGMKIPQGTNAAGVLEEIDSTADFVSLAHN